MRNKTFIFMSLIIIFTVLFFSEAIAIRDIPDDNLSYPVLITLDNDSKSSGFYLTDEKYTYFITARHTIFNKTNSGYVLKSKKAKAVSYPRDINDTGRIVLNLDLEFLNKSGSIKYHREQDLVIIRIAKREEVHRLRFIEGVQIQEKSSSGLLGVGILNIKKYDQVNIANEVYIFGYPTSLGVKDIPQIDYDKPLIRKGIVAGKNDKLKTIILDCSVNKGNSGSPVLEAEKISLGKVQFRLIGMVVSFVPLIEKWDNVTQGYSNFTLYNSDYAVAIPVDYILELLWD